MILLIRGASTGVCMISVCSKMCSTSAAAAPKAHQVEAALRCGTITFFTPSSAANTPACAGPAPPKANSTKSRGSKPFSTVTLRITSAMLQLDDAADAGRGLEGRQPDAFSQRS